MCVEFICIPQLAAGDWRTGLAAWDREGWHQAGSFGGASCLGDSCCSNLSSRFSTEQVKGVLTLQGDALCQAMHTCCGSCFVLLRRGRSLPCPTWVTSGEWLVILTVLHQSSRSSYCQSSLTGLKPLTFQQLLKFVKIQHLTHPLHSVVSGGVDFRGDFLPLRPLSDSQFPWGPSDVRPCVLSRSQFTKCLSTCPLY